MSNTDTVEEIEKEIADAAGVKPEDPAPDSKAEKPAPKKTARKPAGLDRDKPFGTVHGMPGAFYSQGGKLFDADGKPVKG